MRVVTKLSLGAALLGSLVAFSAGAQAHDWDHRDRDRYDHYNHWRHERVVERPVYVRERPVVVERPMMMYAPPAYQAPAPSGLNLNFNIPLQ